MIYVPVLSLRLFVFLFVALFFFWSLGFFSYTSHLTFELLYDEEAAALGEEDVFSVRILYQSG